MKDEPEMAGVMKSALTGPSTFLRSSVGTLKPLIFFRAETRCDGCPVMIAAPLSAANSRYLERVRMRMKDTIQTTRETRNSTMKLLPESRSRLPPPKNGSHCTSIWAMDERNVAMVMTIMSLFLT